MKRSTLFWLALVSLAVVAIQRTNGGSAVAINRDLHITRAYGVMFNAETARRRALKLALDHGWLGARILASTDRFGYCAIALAYKANGRAAVLGVSLGTSSQAEADRRAIASCTKAGGIDPKVYARFEG